MSPDTPIPVPEADKGILSCICCQEEGKQPPPATHLAPQMEDPRDRWIYLPVCPEHKALWDQERKDRNLSDDDFPPIFPIPVTSLS